MARCCGTRRPTARWNGSMALTTNPRHPVVAMGLVQPPPRGRNAPSEFSEACCSPTRPTAPAVMVRHRCFVNPAAPGLTSAIWATACWRTAMVWLVVASEVSPADDYGERAAAVRMARSLPGAHQKTLGANKGYHTRDFVADHPLCPRHAACGTQRWAPSPLGRRRAHHPPCRLRAVDQRPQANRAGVWLDQTGRWAQTVQDQRAITGRSGVPSAFGAS